MKYSVLADIYEALGATSKRLEKTQIISKLIAGLASDDLPSIMLLVQGRLFPPWDEAKLGVAARLVIKAIHTATGERTDNIEEIWKKTGDLGLTARQLIEHKKQATLFSQSLTVKKVYSNLLKLSTLEGLGTVDRKIKLIAELLSSATAAEAQYIVRTVLEDLRVGVGEGSIRDAIVWAYFRKELGISYDPEQNKLNLPDDSREEYNKYINSVQEAYDLTSDFGQIATIIKEKGLKGLDSLNLCPGRPVKVMLVQKAADAKEALDRVGSPAAFEYKYDGFRLQIHKNNDTISLYTRRLENITKQFPEIVSIAKTNIKAKKAILDTETVGIDKKTGKYLAFQAISQRIRRKYDIQKTAEDFPVEVNVFDILFLDGKNTLKTEFQERRKLLKSIITPKLKSFVLAKQLITDDPKAGNSFYEAALKSGNEGIIVKKLDAFYKPGSRVGFCVKIKPVMQSLELAIVKAEWGEGKRANWLTSFTLACRDADNNLLEIGKVSTGLKELTTEGTSFKHMTKLLKPLIIAEKGRSVMLKPEIIIEVNYEEIQKSPTYSSGYALRFPRFIRLREERSINDMDNIETVENLYDKQRNR